MISIKNLDGIKKMKAKILILIIPIILSGCAASNAKITDILQPMPVPPEWQTYTRKPVIEKVDDNFVVSDEFVKKSIQQNRYIINIKRWQIINRVP